jgi:hypothetical protein
MMLDDRDFETYSGVGLNPVSYGASLTRSDGSCPIR